MKKLIAFLVLVAASLVLTGYLARDYVSSEILPYFRGVYRGPEISRIVYSYSANGAGYDRLLDLEEGKYYASPTPDVSEGGLAYVCELDPELKDEFITSVYRVGLFDIDREYTDSAVCGYGWTLTVMYADGSTKVYRGANNSPYNTFRRSDGVTDRFYGISFFGEGETEHGDAPSLECTFEPMSDGGDSVALTLAPANYEWYQLKYAGISSILRAVYDGDALFTEGEEYLVSLDSPEIKALAVKSYTRDGDDEREVAFREEDGRSFIAETGRIYVITVGTSGGYCEYSVYVRADSSNVTK